MAARSAVKRLPDEVRVVLEDWLKAFLGGKLTLDEVMGRLEAQMAMAGLEPEAAPSRSAVHRYAQSFEKVVQRLERTRELTELLTDKLGPEVADGRGVQVMIQAVQSLAYDLLASLEEGQSVDPKSIHDLAKATHHLASAQKTDADRALKIQAERDGFIRDGKLGMDELGDYAEERLRAALYDAFLAEPIRIVVQATVDIVNDLAKQIFGGKDAQGFLGGLLGRIGLNGRAIGNAGIGMAAGQALGLGSGSGAVDLGLALGGQALGSWAGGAIGSWAAGQAGMAALGVGGSAFAGIAGALAPVMGPLGALAGLALGELLKDEKRPYTRADIVAQGGQFVVAGTDTADGGDGKVASELGKAISESLNAAAGLFGIDIKAIEGLYTTAGYVAGGNYKALGGEGYFGGDIRGGIDFYGQAGRDKKGNTLGAGVSFTQLGSAEDLAEEVVRETILRAIAAGASDLSAAEAALVKSAKSLEEAIATIEAGRGFADQVDDMLQELLDPAAFEKKKAIEAVEETYRAMKAEAERLIEAGLISADVLDKLERLKDLQLDAALRDLEGGSGALGDVFASARDRILSFLDGLEVSELAPGGPIEQRQAALEQYERILAMAQLGDERALNDITTYAERLIRADREVTGDAAQRTALYERITAELKGLAEQTRPLTAGAISGPIVEALAGSQTALSQILLSLPPETAAPLLTAILKEPDWASRLLGENVQVPPALEALRAQVVALGPDTAGPIVAAVMATPEWGAAANAQLALLPPSLAAVTAALDGLPGATTTPVIAALLATPAWADVAVAYLQGLPPSLDLLNALVGQLPPQTAAPIVAAILSEPAWARAMVDQLGALDGVAPGTAAPIVAALLATPEWAGAALTYLQGLNPSLDLLAALLDGQPASIADPIVAALKATPGWASALLAWLATQGGGDAGDSPIASPLPVTQDPLQILDGLAGLSPGRGGGSRPYSRADIVAMDGRWTVAGLDAADGGDRAAAEALGRTISDSLNAASALFGLDLKAVEGLYTTAGYVTGGNYKALLGEGFFGGDVRGAIDYFGQAGRDRKGNTLGAGVSFSRQGSAEALAEQVVWETIRRAIDTGGSSLSADVLGQVRSAPDLSAAIQALRAQGRLEVPLAPVERLEAPRTDFALSELIRLREALEQGFNGLSNALAGQLGDLTDATAAGLGDLLAASTDQIDRLRDLASAQRVASAHMLAKAG